MSRRAICLAYIHSHMNLHICAKFGANRPSRLVAFPEFVLRLVQFSRRCTRRLEQKHAKKQHLYIKNYNSGPNMQTSMSLTFFTAIFVAFSSALAEELMIFCRHLRTELYIQLVPAMNGHPRTSEGRAGVPNVGLIPLARLHHQRCHSYV